MTPFKRGAVLYGRVPHPDGGSAVRKLSADPKTAKAMMRMLADLKDRPAWWPVLRAIHEGRLTVAQAFERWSHNTIPALLRELDDVDLEPLVADWHRTLVAQYGADGDTPYRYHLHVRSLLPAGQPFPRSRFTAERIMAWLAGLDVGSSGTRLRYHAALSAFVQYLKAVKVLDRFSDPLPDVPVPKPSAKRVRYLERAEWTRLIDALPARYRGVGVLAHCGAELGAIQRVTVRDVDRATRTVHLRAKGEGGGATKNPWRARLLHIPAWAWADVVALTKGKVPDAPLVEPFSQRVCWAAWTAAATACGITDYTPHDGRHSYAVWMLRAGAPADVVRVQLGHKDTSEVNERYGRFMAERQDHEHWQTQAAARDARREAK